jgi:hypothetical protein
MEFPLQQSLIQVSPEGVIYVQNRGAQSSLRGAVRWKLENFWSPRWGTLLR